MLSSLAADSVVSFAPPTNWKMAEESSLSKNVKAMVIGPATGHVPPSINLATEVFNGSLQDYLNVIKSISKAKGSSWKDLGTIVTPAGTASLSQLDNDTKWGKMRMMHAILYRDGTIYILTAAALKDEFPTYYPQFFSALKSLSITDQE